MLLLQVLPAAGQAPPFPQRPDLKPDVRSRLEEAAQDSTLAPWQREFMLGVASDSAVAATAEPSQALPSGLMRSGEVAGDDGSWIALPLPAAPTARQGHTAIYDPVRDRMVMFGGNDASRRNDVWALSLTGSPVWTELAPAGSPPPARLYHSAIYDPVRDRMVIFGGHGGSPRNDVWVLSLGGSPTWSELTPSGGPPAARYEHTAVYDPVRDRMVIFGGYGDTPRNDVWALSLTESPAWTAIAPGGSPPSPRFGHTAMFDPVRDRMVVFGGGGSGGASFNDVWSLALASPTWSSLATTGSPPSTRYGHTATYDPVHDRMMVFGGLDRIGLRNDVWALSLGGSPAWSAQAPAESPPLARFYHTAIYDPPRDRLVIFGGVGVVATLKDLWAFSLSGSPAWSPLVPAGVRPSPRDLHSAIYDPVRDRMVVFGANGAGGALNDVWALSLSGSPAWTELAPAGSPPSARFYHSAIYDPVRDRMVIFGGYGGSPRSDVWALSLTGGPTWTELAPSGSPPPERYAHTAVYDPVRDRMVVFGGYGVGAPFYNDVWALSLSGSPAWSDLRPAGQPPSARGLHAAIYDPARDRLVIFGGNDGSPRNDVWALSLARDPAWSALAPEGAPPSARYGHTATYDPVRDRMVVFGGYAGGPRNDVWALSLPGSPAWSELVPAGILPTARYVPTTIYDPVRDRMVVFGGFDGKSFLDDAWALAWGEAPPPVPEVSMGFGLTPNTLNLKSKGLWATGRLEPPAPYAASAIDVASIRLNGTVPVDPAAPTALGDHDGNGVPDLMVKFDRAAVEATVSEGDHVPITVTGAVDGDAFSGTDYIRVRRATVSAPQAGSRLAGGYVTEVLWGMASPDTTQSTASPDSLEADSILSVALLYSSDGGNTWTLITKGQPNTGSYGWAVPNVQSEQAKVAVVLVESADSTGDVVNGVLGVSEAFSIETVVGVGDGGPTRLAIRGATPNPAVGGRLRVEFSLRDGSPARLELVDVAGRVLRTRQVGVLGPGSHSLDVTEGGLLRPGIYFLRLTQRGTEVRARAAVVR